MTKEVKRHYNRDEKGKFTKKAPKKMEPTYDSIKAAVNSVVHEFVDETREAIHVNGDICDTSYLLDVDACLRDEIGIEVGIFCDSTKINRTGAATPSYTLYSKVMIPNYDIPAYMLCIAPGMDIESNLVIFNYNATNTIVCIICALLGIDMPTLNVTVENSESADGSGDGCECDACEMECPCRDNPLCDHEDDFDEDDDEFDNVMPYDTIDGTEIYALADDMICSDANYAQHGYALLGVKKQYTVILYGKMLSNDPEHISVDIIILVVDKVTAFVNRYASTQQLYLPNLLNDAAMSGMSLISELEEALCEMSDELVDGGVMETSDVSTIIDRICNNPELADF